MCIDGLGPNLPISRIPFWAQYKSFFSHSSRLCLFLITIVLLSELDECLEGLTHTNIKVFNLITWGYVIDTSSRGWHATPKGLFHRDRL